MSNFAKEVAAAFRAQELRQLKAQFAALELPERRPEARPKVGPLHQVLSQIELALILLETEGTGHD